MSHYYDHSGNSRYTVIGKNGKERDTTVRDARVLKFVPSVTTITSILDKAGLLKYFMRQIVAAAFSEGRQKEGESFEDYVDRLHFAAKKESEEAAKRGSHLHDCLEQYYKGKKIESYALGERDFILPIIKKVESIVKQEVILTPEESFAHELGFGGKVDLHSKSYCFNGKKGIILDFKTKNTTDKKKFYRYNEHLMQLSSYRQGLKIPQARCLDLYFSSIEPGIEEDHEWAEEELVTGWEQFKALHRYWCLVNNYDPGFVKEY